MKMNKKEYLICSNCGQSISFNIIKEIIEPHKVRHFSIVCERCKKPIINYKSNFNDFGFNFLDEEKLEGETEE